MRRMITDRGKTPPPQRIRLIPVPVCISISRTWHSARTRTASFKARGSPPRFFNTSNPRDSSALTSHSHDKPILTEQRRIQRWITGFVPNDPHLDSKCTTQWAEVRTVWIRLRVRVCRERVLIQDSGAWNITSSDLDGGCRPSWRPTKAYTSPNNCDNNKTSRKTRRSLHRC